MSATTTGTGVRAAVVLGAAVATAALAAGATAIVRGDAWLGGWAALAAGVPLIALGSATRRRDQARERLLTSFVDRAFDAAVFGALAWVSLGGDDRITALAVVCLVGGSLAAYARARAASLGYLAGEVSATSLVKVLLVGCTLVLGWGASGLIAVAVWLWGTAAARALQVFKETLA